MKQLFGKKRFLWGIAGALIILLSWLIAPTFNQADNGSTYGKSPAGYSAWYALMEDKNIPIERWKKDFDALIEQSESHPIVFFRINDKFRNISINKQELNWIKKGNIFVILGKRYPVTEAPFSSEHDTPQGIIKIETTRRNPQASSILLEDQFGAILGEKNIGQGKIIYSTTPYLAANAYQDNFSNHEFLAALIESHNPQKIWVDEYIHGYREQEEKEVEEQEEGVFVYLSQTPFAILLIQTLIIVLIALWSHNWRWKKRATLTPSVTNNSQAYIEALASLLQKASRSDFILDTVGKQEQLKLQKELGMTTRKLDDQGLIDAWHQQTEQSVTQLRKLLRFKSQQRSWSDLQLLNWMQQWQAIQKEISQKDS